MRSCSKVEALFYFLRYYLVILKFWIEKAVNPCAKSTFICHKWCHLVPRYGFQMSIDMKAASRWNRLAFCLADSNSIENNILFYPPIISASSVLSQFRRLHWYTLPNLCFRLLWRKMAHWNSLLCNRINLSLRIYL
jgi:hypothetical protein